MIFISMSTDYKMKNTVNLLSKHISIFELFTKVYLFGSVIKSNKEPNDIDLLLIYQKYSEDIFGAKNAIESFLNKLFDLGIDITILSEKELEQTGFMEKIASSCKRLK